MFDFDGITYEPTRDKIRLNEQLSKVFNVMADGRWHTLPEIAEKTGAPETSVSARLRDLRKRRFGSFKVEREYVYAGLWRYRINLEGN